MDRALLERLVAARAQRQPVVLATALKSGRQRLIAFSDGGAGGDGAEANLVTAARQAMLADRSATVETSDGPTFLNVFNPPLRMAIVGAVHITQALAPMAALAGYDVLVIDPRRAFANAYRFPGIELSTAWPDEALAAFAPNLRTAVVTLTHDPKLDDPALAAALKSDAFYIGALGSGKTHASRLERLRALKFDDSVLGRIHGPIGLDIGAKSPAEIAVAIMAQATQALRQAPNRAAAA
jgi:xanthine dehydrogenase accessory factor